jgi:hypothetical protein
VPVNDVRIVLPYFFTDPTGSLIIFKDGEKMVLRRMKKDGGSEDKVTSLIASASLRYVAELCWLNSNFFMAPNIDSTSEMNIYRLADTSLVGSIDMKELKIMTNSSSAKYFAPLVTGILDTKTRIIYPPTMSSLLHLGAKHV